MRKLKVFWNKLKQRIIKVLGGVDTPIILVQENYKVTPLRSMLIVDKRIPEEIVSQELYHKLSQFMKENHIGIIESEEGNLFSDENKKYSLTIKILEKE